MVGGPRTGGVVVGEFAGSGQADENAFGPPVGLESEGGAPVVEQIEFHVASPSVQLKILVLLVVRGVLSLLHQGKIGGNEGFGESGHHVQVPFRIAAVVMVEEDASDAPSFPVAVLVAEIAGAVGGPGLPRSPWTTGLPPGAVEVPEILFVGIVGSQVGPTSEPVLGTGMDHAEVGVDGGNPGILRVEDDGDARRPEGGAGGSNSGDEFLVHFSMDQAGVDASVLKNLPLDGPGAAAAPGVSCAVPPLPVVFND